MDEQLWDGQAKSSRYQDFSKSGYFKPEGADDEYGTPAQLDSIRNHVSGPCRTILLPDCGHVPHFQSRQLATAAIVEFVKSVTAN
jgi:hypothetical protein